MLGDYGGAGEATELCKMDKVEFTFGLGYWDSLKFIPVRLLFNVICEQLVPKQRSASLTRPYLSINQQWNIVLNSNISKRIETGSKNDKVLQKYSYKKD